jgi:hypothetical protein
MAVPARRVARVFVRARVDVKLAWGVGLHTQSGRVHDSLAGVDLTDPFTGRPDLDQAVATEPHGCDYGQALLVIKRTITWAGDGLEEIPGETVAPPTEIETAAVHQALDYLGYAGPRQIRLLLAVDYA